MKRGRVQLSRELRIRLVIDRRSTKRRPGAQNYRATRSHVQALSALGFADQHRPFVHSSSRCSQGVWRLVLRARGELGEGRAIEDVDGRIADLGPDGT